MKIGELAKRSGLSAHTIRYYERIGLLSYALRDAGGQRCYEESMLLWIEFISRLKASGMSIADILHYAKWREQGASTAMMRMELLIHHRDSVKSRIADLQNCVKVLDKKIAGYANPSTRNKDYETKLPSRNVKPQTTRNPKTRRD